MTKSCSLCRDPRRREIDKRLLSMEISKETFRRLSTIYLIHESTLRRHKKNCLIIDLEAVKQAMDEAHADALKKVKAKEMAQVRAAEMDLSNPEVAGSMASRLELAGNYFDQLKILRERAAMSLEKSEKSGDQKTILLAVKELREMIRLWAEIEGKIKGQQINVNVDIYSSPQWADVGRALAEILEPESPDLRQKVAARLYLLAEAHK